MNCAEKEKYYPVSNYTMKYRIYPNNVQKHAIDNAIYAVQCYHNCLVWDMFTNKINTIAKPYKSKTKKTGVDFKNQYSDGDIVHYADLKQAFSAAYKAKLVEEHPIILCAPSSAIITNVGLKADIERALNKLPIEFQEPNYYSKGKPRRSYTYQETMSKIATGDNPQVFWINLAKIGKVKVRGQYRDIRFDENGEVSFLEFAKSNPKTKVTVTISKDNCGDYYICFKLSNVYKKFRIKSDTEIGIDVGVRDIAIQSDGKKYPNHRYKESEDTHLKTLDKMLSRRSGWRNIEFRKERKKNSDLQVSKSYLQTELQHKKVHRKIARKRKWWNDQITTEIVRDNGLIAVETLSVKEMIQNHKGEFLADAMHDAAMSQVLSMLSYKSNWYNRELIAANQYFPSTQLCNCCGYQNTELAEKFPREWDCPKCGTHHDIDINAAKNILDYALKERNTNA